MLLGSLFCLLQKLLEGGDGFPIWRRAEQRNGREFGEVCYTNAGGERTVLGKKPHSKGLDKEEEYLVNGVHFVHH